MADFPAAGRRRSVGGATVGEIVAINVAAVMTWEVGCTKCHYLFLVLEANSLAMPYTNFIFESKDYPMFSITCNNHTRICS